MPEEMTEEQFRKALKDLEKNILDEVDRRMADYLRKCSCPRSHASLAKGGKEPRTLSRGQENQRELARRRK